MPIIQDEGKRMAAYLKNSLEICSSYPCDSCPTRDERIRDDLEVRRYRFLPFHTPVKEDTCTLGLAMAKRMEQYGKDNKQLGLSGDIIALSKSLQQDSVRNISPQKIQNSMKLLMSYIDPDEPLSVTDISLKEVPTAFNFKEIPISHKTKAIEKIGKMGIDLF